MCVLSSHGPDLRPGGTGRNSRRAFVGGGGTAIFFDMKTDMKTADPFYKSRRWERLREKILRRDGYMDQELRRYGKTVQATTVHHIFPREEFPEYAWEPWNLISLSGATHDTLHDRSTNALTAAGIELLKRTARRNGVPIPLRYDTHSPRVR